MPLRTTLPAPASGAYVTHDPLVEPVTTAVLPVNVPIFFTPAWLGGVSLFSREIVRHHGFARLLGVPAIPVTHRQMHVARPLPNAQS
jgi:hypothetical protein